MAFASPPIASALVSKVQTTVKLIGTVTVVQLQPKRVIAHFGQGGRQDGYDQTDLPDVILLTVIVSLFCIKMITKYIASTVVTTKCACILGIPTFVFSNVCMQVKLVNILNYVPILSYENGVTIP